MTDNDKIRAALKRFAAGEKLSIEDIMVLSPLAFVKADA